MHELDFNILNVLFLEHFLNIFQVKYETEFEFMRFLSVVTNIVKLHGFPPMGTGSDFVLVMVTNILAGLTRKYVIEYSHNFNFDKKITTKESDGIARLVELFYIILTWLQIISLILTGIRILNYKSHI